MQLSSSLQTKPSHNSNPKKYMKSWTVGLFVGCKSSMAARKKGQEFYAAAAKRDCPEEMRPRAEHSAAPGLLLRNCREYRLEYLSIVTHYTFALPECTVLPSFFFSLTYLFFKSVVVSMGRVGKTHATKGSSGLLQTSAAALQVRRKINPHLQPLFQRSVLNLNFMALIADYGAAVTSPCSPSHGGHCAFQYLLH